MTCLTCHHDEPHSGGGLGVCLHAGCGCDGPVDGKPVRWVNTAPLQRVNSAPLQRAIDAAVEALIHAPRHGYLVDRYPEVARLAVTAAWPHLCGRLAGENAALREINEERWERASEWEAVAHELAEALGWYVDGSQEHTELRVFDAALAALAAYHRARSDET